MYALEVRSTAPDSLGVDNALYPLSGWRIGWPIDRTATGATVSTLPLAISALGAILLI